jgi:c-di-GMP-binding flagellar brake protein YcgR
MPELIRSVVARVRVYVKDRRQSPRLKQRVIFTVSIRRKASGKLLRTTERVLKGHTRDISITGMALLVPQVHLDGHHLAAEGRELQLKLELPGGPIDLVVVPHRYERVEESELGCNYLIGVRIAEISDQERARYILFLKEGLRKQ